MPMVNDAPLQQRFMRQGAAQEMQDIGTRWRQKGQHPQIHCDKPFPLFREEMPKDAPPPSFPIS